MDPFADVRRLDLPGQGVRLSALEWRPAREAAGSRRILLHHGLASSAGFWGPTAARLAGHVPLRADPASGVPTADAALAAPAHHVVALDARGHGGSDRPDDGYDFATVTADLDGVLEALGWTAGPRPLLVGHSWGGNVVLEYAARHPQVAAGIALIDGGFIELQHSLTWEETERELAPPRLDPMTWDEFAARAAGWYAATGWDAGVEAAVRHNFEEQADGTIRVRLSRERHMQILRAMWEQRPSELYAGVRCPVLIAPARRDATSPREQKFVEGKGPAVALAERILELHDVPVEVFWFDDSIHDIPLQHPGRLATCLDAFATSPRTG